MRRVLNQTLRFVQGLIFSLTLVLATPLLAQSGDAEPDSIAPVLAFDKAQNADLGAEEIAIFLVPLTAEGYRQVDGRTSGEYQTG